MIMGDCLPETSRVKNTPAAAETRPMNERELKN